VRILERMPECLLELTPVAADGGDRWHIYYRNYYVGCIVVGAERCRVWMYGQTTGTFGSLDDAKKAVREWYYGPD
jgi:hypothetical protein